MEKQVKEKAKTASALIILIAILVGLLVLLVVSNAEQIVEKIERISAQENASVEQKPNIISTLLTKITGSLTKKDSAQETTLPTSSSATETDSSSGGSDNESFQVNESSQETEDNESTQEQGSDNETRQPGNESQILSKQEAECIAQGFICEIAACPSTIVNSYLEGNYWKVEIMDDENYTALLEIDAYTGEIKE